MERAGVIVVHPDDSVEEIIGSNHPHNRFRFGERDSERDRYYRKSAVEITWSSSECQLKQIDSLLSPFTFQYMLVTTGRCSQRAAQLSRPEIGDPSESRRACRDTITRCSLFASGMSFWGRICCRCCSSSLSGSFVEILIAAMSFFFGSYSFSLDESETWRYQTPPVRFSPGIIISCSSLASSGNLSLGRSKPIQTLRFVLPAAVEHGG